MTPPPIAVLPPCGGPEGSIKKIAHTVPTDPSTPIVGVKHHFLGADRAVAEVLAPFIPHPPTTMGFLCLPLLSPVGVSRCLPSSPVVEEGARASGPPNGPPDGCPMSKKYFRSYCTNGSTYPDYGCRKYFFSAESFLLAIFYLEFHPKNNTFEGQYELGHLWGSYKRTWISPLPSVSRCLPLERWFLLVLGVSTQRPRRGVRCTSDGSLLCSYLACWEAAMHNYFRGHNNEPPLVHRTPRGFSRSCEILPRVSSQNGTLRGTV